MLVRVGPGGKKRGGECAFGFWLLTILWRIFHRPHPGGASASEGCRRSGDGVCAKLGRLGQPREWRMSARIPPPLGPRGMGDPGSGTYGSGSFLREGAVFGLSLVSFRSPQRNEETDRQRLSQIWRVVNSAISHAETETKGLRARIAKARRSAAFLVEVGHGESDPSSHAKLKTVERYVADAEARVAQLKDHFEHLRRIEAAVTPLSHGTDGRGEHAGPECGLTAHPHGLQDRVPI
jgi:hypothetical protein